LLTVTTMKTMSPVVAAFVLLAGQAHADTTNPVSKAIEMLSALEAKINDEGASSKKLFEEFSAWCEDTSKTLEYEIKTGKGDEADLTASIDKETSVSAALSSKIEDLSGSIATGEADLKAATTIRAKESQDFAAEEKELVEVIGMLERATAILEREMAKGGASFVQAQNAGSIVQALAAMVQASVFSSADSERLTAFVQNAQEDSELGAPDAAVYEGHSGGIIDTLEDLTAKAQGQLVEARKTETSSLHNFEMLKQSLVDQIKFDNSDMTDSKANLAASAEAKAAAEGDLAVTQKDLSADEASLASTNSDCMQKAGDYEAETKSRAEELKALAAAKAALSEMTSGAQDLSYDLNQVSFLQTSSQAEIVGSKVVRLIRDLARKQGSTALAQLASRVASSIRLGAGTSADPFEKIKGLISEMISKLESEMDADASHKAYCDKEMSESTAKKDDKTAEISKLSTKIDQMSAASAKLKEEVATLQKELADLARSQAEMDKLRNDESAAYATNKVDMEQGIEGVKVALKVLREYYASDMDHAAAEGAGAGIIGLIEVAESDFSKGLAEMNVSEETAAASYETTTKENAVTKTMKEQDVKYKSMESGKLDKAVTELTSDREGVQTELVAILDYLKELQEMCVAKPETYADRKAKRDAEIAGLKEALSILESETAFIQRSHVEVRALRGIRSHTASA